MMTALQERQHTHTHGEHRVMGTFEKTLFFHKPLPPLVQIAAERITIVTLLKGGGLPLAGSEAETHSYEKAHTETPEEQRRGAKNHTQSLTPTNLVKKPL